MTGGWCLDGPSRRSIAADYFIPPPPPHLCLAHDAVLMCWVGLLADCCYCMGKIAVPEIKQSALHVETDLPYFSDLDFNFVFLSYPALKVVVVMLLLAAAPGVVEGFSAV